MSDPDRGAYTPPTDAPLSFDARQPVRGGGPAPVMLILSALVLIALVVAIVMFYRSGVREAGEAPRTVGAPVAEMKAAGVYVFAGGLEEEVDTAFSVDATSGALVFTDGPFVETKEYLGGLTVVDVERNRVSKVKIEKA